jgi:hypothetical protein
MLTEVVELVDEIKNRVVKKAIQLKKKINDEKMREFRTKQFRTAEDAAQLGYALSENMKGYKYTTKAGNKLTLKYIGDYIPNYESLKPLANCLGDLVLIANTEKFWSHSASYAGSSEQHMYDVKSELTLAILALYNPELCKAYIESRKDTYDELADMLPGFDFDNPVDYGISDRLRLYYESGCNVYYSDFKYLEDSKQRNIYLNNWGLITAEIVNYKTMGVKKKIAHPDLYNELAPIVNMITSNLCTAEDIDKYIGELRAL